MSPPSNNWIEAVRFGNDGLVPVVAQSALAGEVLMVAYADREALERTRATGRAHYRSRSRGELWQKGATSGHTQTVEDVRVDCDGDAVLYVVRQEGPACHTGAATCFGGIEAKADTSSVDAPAAFARPIASIKRG